MKKISKILFFMMVITFFVNNVYAEENVVYAVSESAKVGKIIFFLISICLMILVLFLSYKIDESEKIEITKISNDENLNKSIHKPYKNNFSQNNTYENQNTNVLDFNINTIDIKKEKIEPKLENNHEEIKQDSEIESDKPYENTKLNDMTMVFKTGLLKKSLDNKKYEEDVELNEIEKTIAKANISKKKKTTKTT